ncbi:unnamed protein product [Victoria cruziana]
MTRTQIVKQLWAYIRKNNLQDPSNKRKIICNDALRVVFETDCTDMFKMNKLLAKHILPLDPAKDSGPDPKRLKTSYVGPLAQGPAISSSPVIISEALGKFFGTGEREMMQTEATERVWNYIQIHRLQDPMNSVVTCDYRLQELFNCEKFPAVGLSEMLLHHFLKR